MTKLFVGNLSWNASEEDIKQLFSEAGEVVSVRVVTDPYTKRSKGFGFVEMADEAGCNAAIEKFDNFELQSRPLRVSRARQENSTGPRPHRGGDRRPSSGPRGGAYAGQRGGQRGGYQGGSSGHHYDDEG